jgi:HlyD family secretion protein
VLKITTESETIVAPGTGLVELGQRGDLEIVVESLSSDAVRVKEAAEAFIEDWGGKTLRARVRRIEPAGFEKISALGIEEQRVLVRLDLLDPREEWSRLGHEYRVFVRIVVWSADDALTVPLSALFRQGDDWAVFKAVDGRVALQRVTIGERNARQAAVESGLAEGDMVIMHPNDRIANGVAIAERQSAGR